MSFLAALPRHLTHEHVDHPTPEEAKLRRIRDAMTEGHGLACVTLRCVLGSLF